MQLLQQSTIETTYIKIEIRIYTPEQGTDDIKYIINYLMVAFVKFWIEH